jgi:choline dehydrogenase-like flavoprotein
MRGHPDDFAAWVAAGATGWGWDDLLPYFRKSETSPFADAAHYGASGPVHLQQPADPHALTWAHMAAGAALGLTPIRDHNGPAGMAGPTLNTLTIRDGRRQSVADAYLTPSVRARPNLELRAGVMVDRLLIADGRIAGLVGHDASGSVTLGAAAGVILSAGTISTPLILMRSGLGPAQELRDVGVAVLCDIPALGANLQDHLLSAGNVYRARRFVPPSSTQHSESLTYIHARGQRPSDAPELVVGCVTVPVVSEALAQEVDIPAPSEGYTLMFGITHPRSRGRLRLRSADPKAEPLIDPQYLSAPADRAHFLEALHWARALGGADSYEPWRKDELLPAPRHLATESAMLDFIERAAFTHHHPVGTCRMGTRSDAAVSPDLALHDFTGLWVCDGSILPSLTTGPVNAAIIAVAERGADLIAHQLRRM